MILGLTEAVFVRRAWLAVLGMPCAALLAGLVGFLLAGSYLTPLLTGEGNVEVIQLRNACLLTMLPSIAIYCFGCWLAELWRRRYAPKCPACEAEFAFYASQVAKTHRCCLCCADVDEPTGTEPTAVGLTRAEFSRRLHLLNKQFARGILVAMLPTSVAGMWLIVSSVVNPLGSRGEIPGRSVFWMIGLCFAWFVAAMVRLRKTRLRQIKSFNLECPKCRAPLPNTIPKVSATGRCQQCHAVVMH